MVLNPPDVTTLPDSHGDEQVRRPRRAVTRFAPGTGIACPSPQACEVGMAHSSATEERRGRVTMYVMPSAMSSG